MKKVTIDGSLYKTKKEIRQYIKPQIIYIPLENKLGVTYKHLIKEGDYVYKGQVVAINEELGFPLHSSVSGNVITGTKKLMNTGKKIKCVVVENDFKEKYEINLGAKRDISKYSKNEFLELLKNCGITGLGGSDYPTYIKYSASDEIKYLIVNGVECEPYVACDKAIMREYPEEILEAIDAILEIMDISKCYIGVKINDYKTINKFSKYIGTYPNIKMYGVEDYYPAGWQKNLVRDVLKVDYKKNPMEKGIIVSNVSTIYAIYEMLKYNRPLTERVITVTGSGVKPVNVKVKIGASMSEIINYLEGYKNIKNPLFIAGGPLMGKSLPSDDLVVTKDLNCVMVVSEQKEKELPCINCGKCISVCPVNLLPIEIKRRVDRGKKTNNLRVNSCIDCGLCAYICPSKINLRESIDKAKEVINK